MKDLVVLEKPELPESWDYDRSVQKVKGMVYKWKNLTRELLNELWIAREILASPGRRTDLTPEQKFQGWDGYCQDIGSSRQVVNRWLARYFVPQLPSRKIELPKGKFQVIYADPPWQYDFSETESRAIESKYPTLSLEQIKSLNFQSEDNAILFLWGTAPKLREALEVIVAWGFNYVTHAIWDKEIIGMGYWFRGQHELLLVGIKGNVSPPNPDNRKPSIIQERRGEHSAKPKKIYKWLEEWFPGASFLELFAREKREGWESWGNEI